ncbi:MAG: hypothetical protein ACOY82_10765 [Pseudomonadota bacterium]
MPVIDCTMGESLRIGGDIRLHLTGRVDEMLYVFIDAAARHELDGVGGFHASAPSGIRRNAHVLALRNGASFAIGDVRVAVEAVRLRIAGAHPLRDVRLHLASPVRITRETSPRQTLVAHRRWRSSCFC